MGDPVRMALVGCGGMGARHALAYAELARRQVSDVQLVAVCDGDRARASRVAQSVATAYGKEVAVHDDLDAMLKVSGIEAIDVVLPTWLHHEIAIRSIQAGKHVLVEKPLAITIRAADKVIAAAAVAGVVVGVAENLRRIPGNRAIKHLIASGELGMPYYMLLHNLSLSDALTVSAPGSAEFSMWFHDRRRVGSFQALELGVHEADLLRYWFGDIVSANAFVARYGAAPTGIAANMAVEDTVLANVRFKSGVLGQIAFSSAGRGPDLTERRISLSTGAIHSGAWINWDHGAVHFADGSASTASAYTADYLKSLGDAERTRLFPKGSYDDEDLEGSNRAPLRFGVGAEIVDFARAVREGRQPEVTLEDGRYAVAVAYALLEAANAERDVTVASVLAGEVRAWQEPVDAALNL